MAEYKTVAETASAEFTEKKSVFIGYASFAGTEEEAKNFISGVKKKHSDARHNCSAYVLADGLMHSSDDGEPSGTAGVPILEVIKKSGLENVVVVVTRYFGGILLGTGGLLRAYSAAAKLALEKAGTAVCEKVLNCRIECQYTDYNELVYCLSQYRSETKDTRYSDKVTLCFRIVSEDFESFEKEIGTRLGQKFTIQTESESTERMKLI